ncbi:MAG: hypothetical protein A2Z71_07820 [Chloroflexi bacterium RBG_13_50_21]|nr:MAG: hypothetical protein A2Z71_07820 [Chloroflexi bacterium RBG_13_50_21]
MQPYFEALIDRFHELHADIQHDLDALPSEALDWKPGPEMNSVNVIIVHLTGAERFLIGDVIMGDPSNRNREAEFKVAGMNKADLIQRLTETEAYLEAAFEKLSLTDLETSRIHPRHGNQVSVAWALLHALEHTGIHVGHIQLTTQLWHQKSVGEG